MEENAYVIYTHIIKNKITIFIKSLLCWRDEWFSILATHVDGLHHLSLNIPSYFYNVVALCR